MELKKRLVTSFFLILIMLLCYTNKFFLFVILNFVVFLSFYEFYKINKKITKNLNYQISIFSIILIYILFFYTTIIFNIVTKPDSNFLFYLIILCIASDAGGYIFGNLFKGKKLTKISPNKTYAGAFGSFIFCILISYALSFKYDFQINLIYFSIFISLLCQIGDLIISFLKRLAKIKDTGNILPGHGGLLDRIDSALLAIPIGILSINF